MAMPRTGPPCPRNSCDATGSTAPRLATSAIAAAGRRTTDERDRAIGKRYSDRRDGAAGPDGQGLAAARRRDGGNRRDLASGYRVVPGMVTQANHPTSAWPAAQACLPACQPRCSLRPLDPAMTPLPHTRIGRLRHRVAVLMLACSRSSRSPWPPPVRRRRHSRPRHRSPHLPSNARGSTASATISSASRRPAVADTGRDRADTPAPAGRSGIRQAARADRRVVAACRSGEAAARATGPEGRERGRGSRGGTRHARAGAGRCR